MGRPREDDIITTKITVGLNRDCDERLALLAKKDRRNKSDMIRNLIYDEYDRKVKNGEITITDEVIMEI